MFHSSACPLVARYGLIEATPGTLNEHAVPCPECGPTYSLPLVFPEKYRYWAQVSDDPEAVLEALYKYDDNNARYLTKVAERLLEEAAKVDAEIDQIYRVEYID